MTRSITYPVFADGLPDPCEGGGGYRIRFASTPEELEAVQRLRFEVFNLELGEGLEESFDTGLDQDRFDPVCHHLMVLHGDRDDVVGTYRIQTHEMAEAFEGFYSADEFMLSDLPTEVLSNAIEIGRASVALPYRNQKVLFLLWRGLAAYLSKNRKRFLFGCCSLTSQDPDEGKQVMDFLERQGHCHPHHRVRPQPEWTCYAEGHEAPPPLEPVKLPKLFRTYIRYGAKVCGPPAIDRFFKTIDYLVLLDTAELDRRTRALFFN